MNSKSGPIRLLAINFGGLGDEVLFLPTLQSIKSQHPEWQITLLTEPRSRSITQVTNLIDANITFDIKKRPLKPADLLQLVSLLRSGKYDIVLSSGSSPQVAGLLFLSGIKQRIGYGSNKLARLLLTKPVALNRNQHATFMYHDLVSGLGFSKPATRPQVIVHDENLEKMRRWLESTKCDTTLAGSDTGAQPQRLVVIHPGTSRLAIEKGIIKTWDAKNWARLIQKLTTQTRARVVLAGGPDDEEVIRQIVAELAAQNNGEAPPGFVNAFGQTASLADLAALMHLAAILICVDSAPMHLGVGLNKPLVALFGPTDPAKLLWNDPARFKPVRDAEAAKLWAGKDPFLQKATQPRGLHSAANGQPQQLSVQIPLDTVFQTAVDLLNSDVCQGSSLECR